MTHTENLHNVQLVLHITKGVIASFAETYCAVSFR